jgi:superfamily I DNA/RNA helicase
MANVVSSDEYMRSLEKLQQRERHLIKRLLLDIQDDCLPNGTHPHQWWSYNNKPLKAYSASDDLRLVLYKWKKEQWLAITCGHHDETYNRAKRMDLSVTKESEVPIIKLIVEEKIIQKPVEHQSVSPRKTYAFGQMPDESLIKIGVPQQDLEKLRTVSSDDELLALADNYDTEVEELLHILANNPLELQSIVDSISIERPRRSIEKILKTNPVAAEHYFLLTEELTTRFFNGSLENWQVFLHKDQRGAVEMQDEGPVLIKGAAGTGKTVVAVHRAKWLLENKLKNEERILITTYVTTLVESIKAMLRMICTPEQLSRIDVINLDAFAVKEWRRFQPQSKFDYKDVELIETMIDGLLGVGSLPDEKRRFFAREYCEVILEHNISSLEQYKAVVRPRRLGRIDRGKAWRLFEFLNTVLRDTSSKGIVRTAALNILAEEIGAQRHKLSDCYASVIVDEAQDFGAPEYRFLAALTGNTFEKPIPHSLYICGDGHQRIYGRSGTLKECGINVPGARSKKLVMCYRSTRRIREYAENILSGVVTRDMNGDCEDLEGLSSLEEGVPVVEKFFDRNNYEEMNKFLASEFRSWHEKGVRYSDMAVLLKSGGYPWKKEVYLYSTVKGLQANGVPAECITKEQKGSGADAVKVMTMNRAKGLQFFGVAVNLNHWPHRDKSNSSKEKEQRDAELDQEKTLLYTAIMRATSRVILTGTKGRPNELPVYCEQREFAKISNPDEGKVKNKGEEKTEQCFIHQKAQRLFKKEDGTEVNPDDIITPSEQIELIRIAKTEFGRLSPQGINEILKKRFHNRLTTPFDLRGLFHLIKDIHETKDVE